MPLSPTQLETRIQELLEGVLEEKHWPELRAELECSEEARKIYCQYARMKSLLRQRSKGIESLTSPEPIIPLDDILQGRRQKTFRYAAVAAVAIIVIALISMRMMLLQEKEPALTFESAPGTKFVIKHNGDGDAPDGMILDVGSRLVILEGTVELTFATGVKSVIMAPADLTLHEENKLYLNQGVAWFHVPQQAIGFQVSTKELDVVDLGTEFGVFALPDDHDQVHVFRGKVQVKAKGIRRATATLTAGQARQVDPVGRLNHLPAKVSQFLTSLPKALPYLHWSFDGGREGGLSVKGNLVGPVRASEVETSVVSKDGKNPFEFAPGKFGNAISPTGKEGFVRTNWPGIGGSSPRTLAYWVKLPPRDHFGHTLIGWGAFSYQNSNDQSFYSLVESVSNTKAVTIVSIGKYWLKGRTSIADNQWHHIACVYTGNSFLNGLPEMYIYVDGELEEVTYHGNTDTTQDDVEIDTNTTGVSSVPLTLFADLYQRQDPAHTPTNIEAGLDELYVFQIALSQSQIKNLYRYNDYRKGGKGK